MNYFETYHLEQFRGVLHLYLRFLASFRPRQLRSCHLSNMVRVWGQRTDLTTVKGYSLQQKFLSDVVVIRRLRTALRVMDLGSFCNLDANSDGGGVFFFI
jgi:hypothetical protein